MKILALRPFIVLLLLVSLVTGSAICGAEAHAASAHVTAAHLESDHPLGSPCCPAEHGADTSHCDSCLSCPCHAPLAVQFQQAGYAPAISRLSIFETFTQLSEVYLPIFVPPQNPA